LGGTTDRASMRSLVYPYLKTVSSTRGDERRQRANSVMLTLEAVIKRSGNWEKRFQKQGLGGGGDRELGLGG